MCLRMLLDLLTGNCFESALVQFAHESQKPHFCCRNKSMNFVMRSVQGQVVSRKCSHRPKFPALINPLYEINEIPLKDNPKCDSLLVLLKNELGKLKKYIS